ncbi:MAG TPA: isoprenylcysteine carboxylmethyltransferase family protein [Bacteroidia bacterium]|jgi:protein-S-isoprenylcysteine O-methyltransferase Ste14|nr:isoprenylcysteine carboxylmethyltransferase family protein [Bacteroidia bacterium]HMU19031.1 isoprenylcysteine carboxylmethyltransferase family protein [Bacteroidia bacterium]
MKIAFDKSKGPGIYIPPPLFYVATFLAAIFLQKKIPFATNFFHYRLSKVAGIAMLITAVFFLFRSLRQFFLTKNTVMLIKPATSLQTTGIYSITRNPMYVGLLFVYIGLTFLIGNLWNFIFFPLLVIFIQEYIIKREEKYLQHEFGQEYEMYKQRVRRWL